MFKIKSRYGLPRDYSKYADLSHGLHSHGEYTYKKGKDR